MKSIDERIVPVAVLYSDITHFIKSFTNFPVFVSSFLQNFQQVRENLFHTK